MNRAPIWLRVLEKLLFGCKRMAILGERVLRKLVMLLVAVEAARAEPVASPKNSRIALRYSTARVLIVGGVLELEATLRLRS